MALGVPHSLATSWQRVGDQLGYEGKLIYADRKQGWALVNWEVKGPSWSSVVPGEDLSGIGETADGVCGWLAENGKIKPK